MGYQELRHKYFIAEHICCYSVRHIKIKHNNVDNINTFKSLSHSTAVAQVLETEWSKWEVTRGKIKNYGGVEGEQYR